MHRLAILTAATLTLTAACGDNEYVPVEVDDDSTADFDRATVDVGREAISDDYVVPSSIFSYARARVTDRMEWADEIGGIGYPGPIDDVTTGERTDGEAPGIVDGVLYDYQIAWTSIGGSQAVTDATQACSGFDLSTAGDSRDRLEAPTHQAPENTAADSDGAAPTAAEATTGEALASGLTCGTPIDNDDSDLADVCQCTDLSCVADFVNETMGCDSCMTFVCGDELLGACAACAP